MKRLAVLKIESFEGGDVHVRCGDHRGTQDFLYAVVAIGDGGELEIIDSGYRSYDEAAEAWPEVGPPGQSTKMNSR